MSAAVSSSLFTINSKNHEIVAATQPMAGVWVFWTFQSTIQGGVQAGVHGGVEGGVEGDCLGWLFSVVV